MINGNQLCCLILFGTLILFSGFFDEQKVKKNSIYIKYRLSLYYHYDTYLLNNRKHFFQKKITDPKLLNGSAAVMSNSWTNDSDESALFSESFKPFQTKLADLINHFIKYRANLNDLFPNHLGLVPEFTSLTWSSPGRQLKNNNNFKNVSVSIQWKSRGSFIHLAQYGVRHDASVFC